MFQIRKIWLVIITMIMFRIIGICIMGEDKVNGSLQIVRKDDQKLRGIKDYDALSMREIKLIDSINLIKVNAIISKYEWPYDNVIDNDGSKTIFYTIQHSNLKTHKKYLNLIVRACEIGRLEPSCKALLIDRIAVQEGREQTFGTQVGQNLETKEYFVFPISDAQLVDERRRAVGLKPLAENLKKWNIS